MYRMISHIDSVGVREGLAPESRGAGTALKNSGFERIAGARHMQRAHCPGTRNILLNSSTTAHNMAKI